MMNKTQFQFQTYDLFKKYLRIYNEEIKKSRWKINTRFKIVHTWRIVKCTMKEDCCLHVKVTAMWMMNKIRKFSKEKLEDKEYVNAFVLEGLERGYEYYKASQLLR